MATQVSLLDGALASAGTLAIQTNGTTSAITISSAQVATFVNNPIMTGLTASRAVFTDGSKGLTSNAITGTGNVVMSASPTLTGTISGAAITLSSDLTLSGGTANGVLYLNGSKVATSGSALFFDGTSLGVGGVPTIQGELNVFKTGSAPTLYVQSDASNSTTQGIIRIGGASGRSASIQGYREAGGSNYHALRFYSYNTADQLNYEITSGGTSIWSVGGSEQMRLTSTGLGIGTSSFTARLTSKASANNYTGGALALQGAVSGTTYLTNAGGTFYISNDGSTDQFVLNSSGNLGLGVTPSAWNSDYKNFAIGSAGQFYGRSSTVEVGYGSNYYRNSGGSYIYLTSAAASYQAQGAGAHYWFTAPSGTAGNAITFTQAMTLDASGNLGIGTTSPGNTLVVGGSNPQIQLSGSGTSTDFRVNAAYGGTAVAALGTVGAHPMFFFTGNTERARIDSSGNFAVGQTPTTSINQVAGLTVSPVGYVQIQRSAGNPFVLARFGSSTGTITEFYYNATTVGTISITASATAYNTSSDYRLKDNPQPLTGSGAFIDALQPKTWNWKADGSKGVGFIAHEAQEVSPSSVTGEKDAVDEDGKPVMQAMEYGSAEFIANIIAELQSLRKRVAELEAK